ncbi:MAG: hypothetical protein ACFE9L_08990 [Candidatus Hodarchaeota archaeon]
MVKTEINNNFFYEKVKFHYRNGKFHYVFKDKRLKVIFESLLIYLACWCKTWKLSDLYGEEEENHFITGKNKFKTTRDRIRKLKKRYKVPIKVERIDQRAVKKGSLVKLDREQVIKDFIEEIKLESSFEQKMFRNVVSKAIHLIEDQLDNYYQNQTFLNESMVPVIQLISFTFRNSQKGIKFIPILISFHRAILYESLSDEHKENKKRWISVLNKATEEGISLRLGKHFFEEIPGSREIPGLLWLGKDTSFKIWSKEKAFSYTINKKSDIFSFLYHSPIKAIKGKKSYLYDLYETNEIEFKRRTKILLELFDHSLSVLFSDNAVLDTEKNLIINIEIPTEKKIIKKEKIIPLHLFENLG